LDNGVHMTVEKKMAINMIESFFCIPISPVHLIRII